MKNFFTLGQSHTHRIQGKTVDCDCVVVIEAPTHAEARSFFHRETEGRFCFSYDEDQWDAKRMHYYPRGYLELEMTG